MDQNQVNDLLYKLINDQFTTCHNSLKSIQIKTGELEELTKTYNINDIKYKHALSLLKKESTETKKSLNELYLEVSMLSQTIRDFELKISLMIKIAEFVMKLPSNIIKYGGALVMLIGIAYAVIEVIRNKLQH